MCLIIFLSDNGLARKNKMKKLAITLGIIAVGMIAGQAKAQEVAHYFYNNTRGFEIGSTYPRDRIARGETLVYLASGVTGRNYKMTITVDGAVTRTVSYNSYFIDWFTVPLNPAFRNVVFRSYRDGRLVGERRLPIGTY